MLEFILEFRTGQTEIERIEFMEKVMNSQVEKTGKKIKEMIFRKITSNKLPQDVKVLEKWEGKGKNRYSYFEQPSDLKNIHMVILRLE